MWALCEDPFTSNLFCPHAHVCAATTRQGSNPSTSTLATTTTIFFQAQVHLLSVLSRLRYRKTLQLISSLTLQQTVSLLSYLPNKNNQLCFFQGWNWNFTCFQRVHSNWLRLLSALTCHLHVSSFQRFSFNWHFKLQGFEVWSISTLTANSILIIQSDDSSAVSAFPHLDTWDGSTSETYAYSLTAFSSLVSVLHCLPARFAKWKRRNSVLTFKLTSQHLTVPV